MGHNSFAFVMATLIPTFILPKAATNGRSLPLNEKVQPFQNQEWLHFLVKLWDLNAYCPSLFQFFVNLIDA
ncbi:hypothetical protein B8W96_02070 [Lentilactobacillus parakefiri]|nr:hypothetical protein B8W96_02070 [Lentilactobacillus parakefiri]